MVIRRVSRPTRSASPISHRSLLRMWLSSCPSTPASSRRLKVRSMPSVSAITASSRSPTANAFSIRLGM